MAEDHLTPTTTESRLTRAKVGLSNVTGGLCSIHRLAVMAICTTPGDPEAEALLVAIRDLARLHARTLDACAQTIGGGPAVGCFADDLASD